MKAAAWPLRRLKISVIALLLVTGLNALAAGYSFISDPDGSGLGLSLSYLKSSPFSSYLIPGLVLCLVIGIGCLTTAWFTWKNSRFYPATVCIQGFLLSVWITVQVIMVRDFHLLHLTFLLIGLGLAFAGFVLMVAAAREQFNRSVAQDILRLPKLSLGDIPVTIDMLADLPEIVRKWLLSAGVVDKALISTAILTQKGDMRTGLKSRWMPFTATQYITIPQPAFLWAANVCGGNVMRLAGKDRYQDGLGHMLIKLLWLLPVANAAGTKIDQGSLVRYLAEIVWIPTAALSKYITWEELSPLSAKATISYKDKSASGVFTFDQNGNLSSFEAMRYFDRKSGPTLEKWVIEIEPGGFRTFAGYRIPAACSVTWKLSGADFTWYKVETTGADYNEILKPI